MLLGHDDESVNSDAHDDRRHAIQNVGGKPDHIGQTLVAAKLGDIDAAGNTDRHAHQAGNRQ